MKAPSGGGVDVRIGDREAAADIDHVDRHAGGADHLAGQRQARAPGQRVQALRADMEAQAEPRRMRPRRAQQRGGLGRRGAELAGQVVAGDALRQRQPHEQAEAAAPRRRRSRPGSSPAPPALSSTKSRTPCRAQASRIAPRAFTGCMKWMPASGNMLRTSATSAAEAQSKCRTPPAQTARSTAGSGLHFTAYSTSPGKRRDEGARRPRRRRPGAGNASAPPAARRRPGHRRWAAAAGGGVEVGGAAGRRRRGRGSGSSRESSQASRRRASGAAGSTRNG